MRVDLPWQHALELIGRWTLPGAAHVLGLHAVELRGVLRAAHPVAEVTRFTGAPPSLVPLTLTATVPLTDLSGTIACVCTHSRPMRYQHARSRPQPAPLARDP